MTIDTQTKNPLPSASSGFLSDLQTFLANEDAERFVEMLNPFVLQNGLHGTVAGLTGNPGNTIAYPAGYRTTETNSITYPDNSANIWVVLHKDTVTAPSGDFVRVAGTHYMYDAVSSSQPSAPADSLFLMRVVTSGGSITFVTDLRNLSAFTLDPGKVKITNLDTTLNFLDNSLLVSGSLTKVVNNPGGDETLTLAASDTKTKITVNDTTENFLDSKITVTAPLTKTVNNPGGNETLNFDINDITTADIADDAVTLAKIAHGTDGEIFVYGTDTSPTTIPVGVPGRPLITKGAGNVPVFERLDVQTGLETGTAGDILYWDASNNPQVLPKGTDGQELILSGGLPVWGTVNRMQIFESSGTWVRPDASVTIARVLAMGGAGGGAGGNGNGGGGGGGGGAYIDAIVTISGNVTVTIGAGGAGGGFGLAGSPGGTTTFGSLITVNGGGGGTPHNGATGDGGAGGTISSLNKSITAFAGSAGETVTGLTGGGGGFNGFRALGGGNGANGGVTAVSGTAGLEYANGGGGGGRGTLTVGGGGRAGLVIVMW